MSLRSLLSPALCLLIAAPAMSRPAAEESLEKLKEGNNRYLQGIQKYPKIDPVRRLKTAVEGQKPIATILGCSDARVPVEVAFDKAFGDLFIVRVAGNVCQMAELASIEYGVNYLKTPLVVVLGHTKCGAVHAAASGGQLVGSLPKLIEEIRPAVEAARKKKPALSGEALAEAAIEENVWKSIEDLLKGSPSIRAAVKENKVLVVGAIRDLKSGKINWLGSHPAQKQLLASISSQ
ncbi:MAG TPA: carbonic anhydrase [Candidatus Obscuribacterales bacterium]